jgi:hypothetical protein
MAKGMDFAFHKLASIPSLELDFRYLKNMRIGEAPKMNHRF